MVGSAIRIHEWKSSHTCRFLTILFLLVLSGLEAGAQTRETVPGTFLTYATIHSIGIEWDLTGDTNHDAVATVEYRRPGSATWQFGSPLLRIDVEGRNMLAGSLMFLQPATAYEVRVTLHDPDGGADARTETIATRPIPTSPGGRRVRHVVPGSGGGDGSAVHPFMGIAAAQTAAEPGDTFLLHAGAYGGRVVFDRAGTSSHPIVWKAAGDGEVLLAGIDIAASHLWLEGVTVRDQMYGVLSSAAPAGVVITRSSFFGNHYAILLSGGGSGWYITDNTIVGDTPAASGSTDGEGIDLNVTNGHTVAYNSITNVSDGISSPRMNVDILGNDIFDTSDDGIELDFGLANVRVWNNRIHNAAHNAISFQPQASGPWYIVRNQIVGSEEAAFKFRATDRFVLVHNTIVHWGTAWPGTSMMCCNEDHLLRAYARNNLWISIQGGQIWGFDAGLADWRSDLDYDGFDWGTAANPFNYGGIDYADVASFASASGLERHGVRVDWRQCFDNLQVPGPSPAPVPPQVLTLAGGCAAIDTGAVLPNLGEGFLNGAPDLGAHEFGMAPAVYGPRACTPGNDDGCEGEPDPSPNGTEVPPAPYIVDGSGTIWTLGAGGETLRDGVHAGWGYGLSLLWSEGTLYTFASDDNWWTWTGTGWIVHGRTRPGSEPITASPDGTELPPAAHIIDTAGAHWTLGAAGATLRDGVHVGGGYGWSLLWSGGIVYAYASDSQWWQWTGSSWVVYGPMRPGGGQRPASPSGTNVPPAPEIVDDAGAVWTLGTGGAILRNGVHAAGGYGSALRWDDGALYAYASDDQWWIWAGTYWTVYGPAAP